MQILRARFLLLTPLLLLAFLLLHTEAYAGGLTKLIEGAGTFRDLKGPSGVPPDEGPGPRLLRVTLRIPESLDGPGEPDCQLLEPEGVCEVDLEKNDLRTCDDAVGKFASRFDVICLTDITVRFDGLFSGDALLHDTFAVYGGFSGGYFTGPAIFQGTVINPKNGKELGTGRLDFIPNAGTFDEEFKGSGSFRINRAYGELAGLAGQGTFEGTIGQQGTYKAVIRLPKKDSEDDELAER
jgi:hypothetical protein